MDALVCVDCLQLFQCDHKICTQEIFIILLKRLRIYLQDSLCKKSYWVLYWLKTGGAKLIVGLEPICQCLLVWQLL